MSDTIVCAAGYRCPTEGPCPMCGETALGTCKLFENGVDPDALLVRELRGARARIERLTTALQEAAEFIEDQVDVVDGDYGIPAPNRAMQLTTMINEALR